MTDNKILYFTLFNKVTDVIEELQEIQSQMEEMYIKDSNKSEQSSAIEKKEI